jgi:two-component system, NtrC family, sensor histidine kinase HupT/HoxJ
LETNKNLDCCKQKILQYIRGSNGSNKNIIFEKYFSDIGKYFEIEINPVYISEKYLATVILFKDISEHKRVIDFIEQNQNKLIEDERLKSLGQFIGGIAHNLKTPIMVCSGGIDIISQKVDECREFSNYLNNTELKEKYDIEIIDEITKWTQRIENQIAYMDNIISTVKRQAAPEIYSENDFFTVKSLADSIKILMTIPVKKACCKIVFDTAETENLRIAGKMEYLVQVLNNLILNAIQAYDGKGGIIEFTVKQGGEEYICFSVRDYGKGISLPVQKKLFNQMVTTKGKNGTGLGLYISKAFIASKFNGKIEFESVPGKGSVFTVIILIGGEKANENNNSR